jgi:hypothetical protein
MEVIGMKFEYENRTTKRECVAMIHNVRGDLIIQSNNGCLALGVDGMSNFHKESDISFWDDHAAHKFYPGDKITITF